MALTGVFPSNAISARVTGVLDQWHLWSFDTDTITAACIAGESPCDESQVSPDPFSGLFVPIDIPVQGEAKLADRTVVALTLVQTREVSLPIADGRHGELTLSGLSWTLENGSFQQAAGAFAECSTLAPVCRVIAAAILDPAIDSPLNFDGIPQNFPIQFGALLLNQRPAFRADVHDGGFISIRVASNQPQVLPTSTIFNAATIIRFSLTIAQERP